MHTIARGSTPDLVFNLPISTDLIESIFVTIYQTRTTIELDINALQLVGKQVIVRLSQEQTLALKSGYETRIQMRLKDKPGKAYTSSLENLKIIDAFKQGVI